MKTQDAVINDLKTKLMESLADYISGIGDTTKASIFALATNLYNNPHIKNDTSLAQCTSFLHFLSEQMQSGNADILNQELIEQMFMYTLQKLTTGSRYQLHSMQR